MINFLDYIKILRPLNLFLSFFSVIITSWLLEQISSPIIPFIIVVVISFAGAANILNDIFDIKIDKINRPNRPLPSGKLKIKNAMIFSICLLLIGIYYSQYLHPFGRNIALFIILPIIIIYTPILKKIPLIGNLVIGLILGFVFLFTESSIKGSIDKAWIPFYLATILSTIREIIKDAADIKGDAINNIKTFPRKFGLKSTLWLIRFFTILLYYISCIPWINGIYNSYYISLLIVGVIIPSFYIVFIKLKKESNYLDYLESARLFKAVTISGLLVILSTGLS
tara:strand:- start:1831 stop:2676 length:846 start_codon:yes stop_codon:yes gene_type:complete